jgi:methyltransferase (TIGR00027 family)
VFLARDPGLAELVPAGAARWCARCLEAAGGLRTVSALSHPALRRAALAAERATIPGLLLHFMLRKLWIEEAVRAALAGGCVQVVVLGAGFDTLALRLAPEFPHAGFVEVDHPATQAVKRLAVEGESEKNLRFVAADLAREPLREALARGSVGPGARSVFVIEGLLMYLDEAGVAELFARLAELQHPGSRVVFTAMEPGPGGRSAFHNATPLVRWLLARWSEPFRSALPRADAAAFLECFGYRLHGLADHEALRRRYLASSWRAPLPLARGEIVLVADK